MLRQCLNHSTISSWERHLSALLQMIYFSSFVVKELKFWRSGENLLSPVTLSASELSSAFLLLPLMYLTKINSPSLPWILMSVSSVPKISVERNEPLMVAMEAASLENV
uniref:Uncharacterized protein n=1 Tax=Cacopsylla melanoneura TaxID=428564 RepID=A0A8D9E7H8_9HEMI